MKCLQIGIPEMGKCIIKVKASEPDEIVDDALDVATMELRLMLEEGTACDRIVFELVEMTEEEYAQLPEWEGW